MTQGERVRELRKSLNLTTEKFGEKLGVQRSAISKIENGRCSLTDANINAICREFSINRTWLTSGEGDMRIDSDDDFLEKIDRIMTDENKTRKNMMKALVNASDDDIEVLSRLIVDAYNSLNEDAEEQETYENNRTASTPKPTITLDSRDTDALSAAVREAEESYIKSRSGSARKKVSSASNITDGEDKEAANT